MSERITRMRLLERCAREAMFCAWLCSNLESAPPTGEIAEVAA